MVAFAKALDSWLAEGHDPAELATSATGWVNKTAMQALKSIADGLSYQGLAKGAVSFGADGARAQVKDGFYGAIFVDRTMDPPVPPNLKLLFQGVPLAGNFTHGLPLAAGETMAQWVIICLARSARP